MALDLAVIQEVVIDDSKSVAAAQRVVAAQGRMQEAVDKTTKATGEQAKGLGLLDAAIQKSGGSQESALRRLNMWKAAADDNERVIQRLARAEVDLDRAIRQGKSSQEEKIRILGQLEAKMRGAAAANDNLAGGMRGFGQAVSMLPGPIGGVVSRITMLSSGLGVVSIATGGAVVALTALATGLYTLAQGQDQLQMIEARLRNVTGSATAASEALRPLFEGSQRTGVNFNDTIQAFQRLGLAARDMGAAQSDVIKLTQAVQQLGRLGGGSTQELQSAMIQFGQALASGRLQGDELRSIMENMPLLARAIADGLGVSVGQLREMGKAGELTSERVFKAILGQTDEINRKFTDLPQTVDMGMTRVANAWDLAIGRMGKSIQANKPLMLLLNTMAAGLESIAEGLDDSVMARASRLERAANDPGRVVGTDAAGNPIRDRSAAVRAGRQLQDMQGELQDDAFIRTVEAANAANENIDLQNKATEDLRKKAAEVSAEYQRQTEIQKLGEDAVKRIEAREKAVADVLKGVGLDSLEGINSLTQERADIILQAAQNAADEAEQKVRIEQGVKAAEKAEKERLKTAKATADELNRWLDLQQETLKADGERVKAQTDLERAQMAANDNLETYIRKLEDAATVDAHTTTEKKVQQAIIEAQNKLYDKQGEKLRDLEQAEKDRIATAVRQTEELEKQRKAADAHAKEVERVAQRAEDQLSDALGDTFFDYLTGKTTSFWQTFKNLGLRAIAETAASAAASLFRPAIHGITNWLMGSTSISSSAGIGSAPQSGGGFSFGNFSSLPNLFNMSTGGNPGITGVWNGVGNWLGLGGAAVAGSGAAIGWGGVSAATLASAEAAGLGATVTGGYGALAGGAGAPVAASIPWAGALGAAGLGFAGGSLLASLTGGNQIGGGIGGGIGAGAGFLIGGPVGALIGGVGGSLLGGMFGPGKSVGPTGHVNVGSANGRLYVGSSGADNGGDVSAVVAQAQQLVESVNHLADAYGLSINGSTTIGFGKGYPGGLPTSAAGALQALLNSGAISSSDPTLQTILRRGGDAQQLEANLQFGGLYNSVIKLRKPANDLRDAFEDLAKQFDANIEKARGLGLSEAAFRTGTAANFNQDIERSIRAITDPLGLALDDFAEVEQARLDYAKKIGADIVDVERLNMLERQKILQQSGMDIKAWLDAQLLGNSSTLTGSGRLTEAQAQLQAAMASNDNSRVLGLADYIAGQYQALFGGTSTAASGIADLRGQVAQYGRSLGLPGFDTGGSFTVGAPNMGWGGVDATLVRFRANQGEQVTVTPPGVTPGGASSRDIGELALIMTRMHGEAAGTRRAVEQQSAELRKLGQMVDLLMNRAMASKSAKAA